jgi:glycosyltransferase involved in cell wall biosynthesis
MNRRIMVCRTSVRPIYRLGNDAEAHTPPGSRTSGAGSGPVMRRKYKFLMLNCALPYPLVSGSRIRDYYLIREMSRAADVVLCSFVPYQREIPEELRRICTAVECFRPGPRRLHELVIEMWHGIRAGRPVGAQRLFFTPFADRIRTLIEEHAVDVVQIEHSQLAGYVDAIPTDRPICKILSLHNLGWVQSAREVRLKAAAGRRTLSIFNALTMRNWEARYAERFDHCITVSELDAARVRARNPRLRVSTIENGVDCGRLRPLPEVSTGNDLLFVGLLDYPPNADAVLFFCDRILPAIRRRVANARLLVIGDGAPPAVRRLAGRDDVVLAGQVEDVVPYYQRSPVSVVPLRAGSGTRLKILEAMALGRPVVATGIGCEGLDIRHGREFLIADTAEEFARSVVRLLGDPGLRRALATQARARVEERYDWPNIGRKLLALHHDVLAANQVPSRAARVDF